MTRIITTKLSKSEVKRVIREIPGIISGRLRDPHQLHNKFWGAVALSMFESLHKAFEQKSLGLQDELGIFWSDINEETKAYSRPINRNDLTTPQRRASKNKNTIGLLTPTQYKEWKKIFSKIYYSLREKLGESEAKEFAAQVAWDKLKKSGASTKIDVLGRRDLLIMRNSDKLFKSFFPGKLTKNSYRKYNKDQVYIVEKGSVTVGTQVDYAGDAFEKRPMFAGDMSPWIRRATKSGSKRLLEYLQETLT